jgi:hypothetical protein
VQTFVYNMKNNRTLIFTIAIIALTVVVKFICAPVIAFSGVSTVVAISLFAGMSMNKKQNTFFLPLIALFASDVIIEILYRFNMFEFQGFYKGQILNYSLLLLSVLIGWAIKGKNIASLGLGAFAASTIFFLLSNFSVWYSGNMYPKDFNGLMLCYESALPFYRNQLLSTILFLPLIILAYNYIVSKRTNVVFS